MFVNFQDTAIATLDLDPIKVKLIHSESGEGWTRAHADAVELEYRRFLYLMKKYPQEVTAPVVDVDTFWHYHILDTMKYAADCERVFGYFLHHFPYYGMRGEEDFSALAEAGNRMQELYEQTFGVAQFATAPDNTAIQGGAANVMPAYRETAAGTQAAYCIKAPQSAYCIRAAKPAYCIRATEAAYCIKAVDAAYCIRAPNKSDERTTSRQAYTVPDGTRQQSASTTAAYCIKQAAQMNRPGLVRPRLAGAAT